jgi:hypothetical protein
MFIFLAISIALIIYTRNIHRFLSISKPVNAKVLVIEDGAPLHLIEMAAFEFKEHDYSVLMILGKTNRWIIPYLINEGIDEDKTVRISVDTVERDRTFASAIALKNWFLTSQNYDKSINVLTLGVHARRSWMLFRSALGPEFSVGVIAYDDPAYDRHRWWSSSEGFKKVIDETIAYVYTRIFVLYHTIAYR